MRQDDPAVTEHNSYVPSSPYAATKAATDHLVRAYHRTSDPDVWCRIGYPRRGIELELECGREGEVYNIGGGVELSNIDLVRLICHFMDKIFEGDILRQRFPESPDVSGECFEALIIFAKDRPGHDFRYAFDIGKIQTELGYMAMNSLMEGIEKTIYLFLGNETWWRGIMQQPGYRERMSRYYRID